MTYRLLHRCTLLSVLLFGAFSSQLSSASTLTIEDIKPDIIAQLPAHLELTGIAFNSLENAGNNMLPIYKASMTIKATLKEPLYTVDGNENGKLRLRQSMSPGAPVSHTATVIAMMPGGINTERKVTMVLDENGQFNKQFPRSAFPAGGYTIAAAQQPSSATVMTPVATSHQPDMTPLRTLVAAQDADREIWGRMTQDYRNVAPANSPIVLKNIELTGNKAKGKIEYPDLEKSFDVSIVPLGSHMIGLRCVPKEKFCNFSLNYEENVRLYSTRHEFLLNANKNAKVKEDMLQQSLPWEQKVAPENLLQLSNTLWDVSTGKLLDNNWIADSLRPIEELPGKYWPAENDGRSAVPGVLPFIPYATAAPGTPQIRPIPEPKDGDLFVSRDLRRFIEVKQGDLWIATVNWQEGSFSSPKNLTNSGELYQPQILAWYGNEIYLHTKKRIDKPVLRVNTDTGATDTLPYSQALMGRYGSPDGRYRINHGDNDKLLHVYDLATHEEFTMDAYHAYRRQGLVSRDHTAGVEINPDFWVSSMVFFSGSAWYDLEKREHKLITDIPEFIAKFPRSVSARDVSLVPGGDYIDIRIEGYDEFGSGEAARPALKKQRYRIHRMTNEITPLPELPAIGWNKEAVWIDANRYVFYRSEGSPEEIGLWLYDIPTETSTLISQLTPNHSFRAKNPLSGNLEQIGPFNPVFKESPFLVITDHERVGFTTEVDGKFVFALVSLKGEEPKYLEIPKQKMRSKVATLFINDPVSLERNQTVAITQVAAPTKSVGSNSKPSITKASKGHKALVPVTARSTDLSLDNIKPHQIPLIPWEAQANYFAAFPFRKGDYALIQDPSATFRDLYVRIHQGKALLGAAPEYDVFPRYDQRKQFADAFKGRLAQSTDYYGLLCTLKNQRGEFTPDKISHRDNYGNYYAAKSGFQPYTVLTALAYSAIKSDHFGQYFCADSENCGGEEDKARWLAHVNVHKAWGGLDASETDSRQALASFLDKELPKLFEWADSLSCDVALTVPTLAGGYDAATQALNFTYVATPFSVPMPKSELQSILNKPREYLSAERNVSTPQGTPLKFFAVVNGSFSRASFGGSLSQGYGVGALPYFLALDTDNISIFADDLLTDEVGKANLPAGTKIKVINGSNVK